MTLSRYSAITNVLQILREVEKAKERKEIWVDQFLADCDCDLDSTITYMEAMHGDLSCAYCGGDCPNDLDNACDEALKVKIPAKITSDCGAMTNEYIRGFVILAALIAGNFAFQASYDNPNWAVATERSFFEFWAIFVFLLTSRPISKKDFRNFDEKELVEIQKLSKLIVETIESTKLMKLLYLLETSTKNLNNSLRQKVV